MRKLDRVVIAVLLIQLFLLAGVIYFGNSIPVEVTCLAPANCSQISPLGSMLFEFSRPVRSDQVEKLFKTIPDQAGRWEWVDERHGRWRTTAALRSDQIFSFQFIRGQGGKNGEQIQATEVWKARVRSPQIIAVPLLEDPLELYVFNTIEDSAGVPLTKTGGRILDYEASPDGEMIIYSVVNDQNGTDLWMMQRDGGGQHKILDCQADRCSTASWSPLDNELAYTREGAGLKPNGAKGAPRVWIFDLASGETAPLFADSQKIGYGPKWSPDGQWLSIWDGTSGGISVVNRKTGKTILVSSSNGDTGCWSIDSQFLYYSDMVLSDAGFRNVILQTDVQQNIASTIFGGNVEGEGLSIGSPICNPKDNWIAVSVQPDIKLPGKRLLIKNLETKEEITVSEDLSLIPSSYSWSPDGSQLVFQVYKADGSNEMGIWAWNRKQQKVEKIADNFHSPKWLP
jgi:Tol biopolymer transport system component